MKRKRRKILLSALGGLSLGLAGKTVAALVTLLTNGSNKELAKEKEINLEAVTLDFLYELCRENEESVKSVDYTALKEPPHLHYSFTKHC